MLRTAMHLAAVFPILAGGASAADEPLRLQFEMTSESDRLELAGAQSRAQVVVTAVYAGEVFRDVTRDCEFAVADAAILRVTDGGVVAPLSDGSTTLAARFAGQQAELPVTVSGVSSPPPIHFANQVVPVFTRLGCNGGGCHGKSGGQNGFRLALLGFHPEEDFEYLRKEARGRRIFPGVPEESLLLKKATGQTPHGGGRRMTVDSSEYALLTEWIRQGMPFGDRDAPTVASIRCIPESRVLQPGDRQQVRVVATRTDGSTEDVTAMALFESNDAEMADCTETGLVVAARSASGQAAVMARFQGHVAVFRATIPLGADTQDLPTPRNAVDEAVFAQLRQLGIPPSPPADDATFLRRVTLDITGRLPTPAEAEAFASDPPESRRDALIDRLLDSREYADYFANKWNFILRNNRDRNEDAAGTYLFHQWIWQSLYDNKPWDQFVTELLTATGDPLINPAATWYRDVDSTEEQVEDTAQLFLGIRIQCARCHHHPFEIWSQDDYYSLAAYFSRLGKKPVPNAAPATRDRRLFHNEGAATARNPRSGRNLTPSAPGQPNHPEIPAAVDPRSYLAAWMATDDNHRMAKSLANRYWKHFTSRGLVEPEDDMRATNPPSNPALLDALAAEFTASGFDLKHLIRTICRSRTYQFSSSPNAHNESDRQNYSRYYARRLSAEVLFDAIHQINGTTPDFGGLPDDTAAMQLADSSVGPYFLEVFGQPKGDTACECERSIDANLAQSLHLLNGKPVQQLIAHDDGIAAKLAADTTRSPEDRIHSLYQRVFTRSPTEEERQLALRYLADRQDDPRHAWEDIVWALINTREFQFNH